MRTRPCFHRLALTVLLGCLLAFAGQEPQKTVPTFRVGADLVVVDVTVRDKQGKPVQNLTDKDFLLLEDGQAQQIQLFAVEDILSEEPRPPSDLSVKRLSPPPKKEATSAKAEPPAAAAGVAAPPETEPATEIDVRNKRWIILFFDMSSLPTADMLRAQKAALDYVNKQMTGGDLVSMVTFASSLKVVQDFTQDRDALKEKLNQLVRDPESPLVQIGEATATGDTSSTKENAEEEENADSLVVDETEFNIFNSDRKLAAIETIAQWLTPYPEKKALIHYSGGNARTGTENQAQLRATTAAAERANMSIYPVDARGLVAMPAGGDASRASSGSREHFNGRAMSAQFSKHSESQDTLWALAEDTGGKAFLDNNDLSPVFSQVHQDINHYYVLGYYSTNPRMDGKYRQIKVQVNVPGVKVTHRQGYYAPKDFTLMTREERRLQLEVAASLGDVSSDLPLALVSGNFRTQGDVYYVPVSLRFPTLNVPFMERKGLHQAEFDFVGQVRGEKGRLVTFIKDTVKLKLDDPTFKALTRKSLQYDTGFYLKSGEYALKFLVRENQTGRLGVFEEKLVIPAPSATSLDLSSVILGSQLQDLKVSSETVRVEVDKDLAKLFRSSGNWQNPLVFENRKLVPSVTRLFHTSDPLYVAFEIYGAAEDTSSHNPDVVVAMTFWQNNRKINETPVYHVTHFSDGAKRLLRCRYRVPLNSFQPGTYTLQINVVDQAASRHTHTRLPLAIR